MDPVQLIVEAMAAGAGRRSGATGDAYETLKRALAARFAERQIATAVLEEHEEDPETFEKPLAKRLRQAGAADDPRIVALARALLHLIDPRAAESGKYHVEIDGVQGLQVGDHNTQTNDFRTSVTASGTRSIAAHTVSGQASTGDGAG